MHIDNIREIKIEKHFNPTLIGSLRNERKFNLGDSVYLLTDNSLLICEVIGVEITQEQNPNFLYKLKLPNEARHEDKIKCSHIYKDAKQAYKVMMRRVKEIHQRNLKKVNDIMTTK